MTKTYLFRSSFPASTSFFITDFYSITSWNRCTKRYGNVKFFRQHVPLEIGEKSALDLSQNWENQRILDSPTAAIFPSLLVGRFQTIANKIHEIASRENFARRLRRHFSPVNRILWFRFWIIPISYPESSDFLVSGWAPVETHLGNSKKFQFFDWLPCNDFHCFTAEILR